MLRRSDYMACYDEGRRLASRHFVVFLRIRPDTKDTSCALGMQDMPSMQNVPDSTVQADWRVGMAVTKKIGCAVIRNRVKRVLREFFRLHQPALPPGVDLVVIPKKHLSVATMTLDTTTRELLPVLADIRRLPGLAARAAVKSSGPGSHMPDGYIHAVCSGSGS